MTAPTWTPAPRPGLIPLRPLGFGTILGKSFGALRHNPKVLFGFAVLVQIGALLLTALVVGGVTFATFSRLETVPRGSQEYTTIAIGSAAIVAVTGLVAGIASSALAALVQGVVAADVGEAVLGEKPSLRALWRRVGPVAWRLIGWSLLTVLVVTLGFALIAAISIGGIGAATGFSSAGTGIGVLVLLPLLLGFGVVLIWLGTKLSLVPAAMVLEHVRLRQALTRSWRLTRGRFWVAFGIAALISVIMYIVTQVVAMPASILGGVLLPVLSPTGSPDVSSIGGMIITVVVVQVFAVVVQAIGAVVQATGSALVYVDCRMRYEGLDQELLASAERRQAGVPDPADPFSVVPDRAVPAGFRPAPAAGVYYPPPPPGADPYAMPYTQGVYPQQPSYPQPGYPQPPAPAQGGSPFGYPQPGYPQAPYGQAAPVQAPYGQVAAPAPTAYGQTPPPPPAPPAPPAVPAPPASAAAPETAPPSGADPGTDWTAPGSASR